MSGMGPALQDLTIAGIALLVVGALAFVCLNLIKRLQLDGAGQPGAELRLVHALPVGPRERLVVVEWRGETLLLGVAAGGISVLDRDGAEPAARDLAPQRPDAHIAPADLTRVLLSRVFPRKPRANPS